MANIDYQYDDEQPRPNAPQPPPAAAPNPRDGNTFDYGNGTVAQKVAGGWLYPELRPTPFQDLLGDTELEGEKQLKVLRDAGAARGLRLDAGDAELSKLLAQHGGNHEAALASISQAQQGGASRDQYSMNAPGFQFSDPYTKQLEDVARQQMANLSQPQQNPQLDQLIKFLGDRFQTLTTTPGYSPDDMAVMRTQALDPIEQDRQASRQRALQKAAQGGYLPTSGITDLVSAPNGGVEGFDATYDRMRAAAQRDLAINAITKRNSDLQQAVSVGSLAGIQIPQGQRAEDQQRRSEMLNLASLLYDLPARAQAQAMAVINGTEGPKDLFSQALQSQQQQIQQQQQDAAKWSAIGQLIAGMTF